MTSHLGLGSQAQLVTNLAEFYLVVRLSNHQSAKYNYPTNFLAILYTRDSFSVRRGGGGIRPPLAQSRPP